MPPMSGAAACCVEQVASAGSMVTTSSMSLGSPAEALDLKLLSPCPLCPPGGKGRRTLGGRGYEGRPALFSRPRAQGST